MKLNEVIFSLDEHELLEILDKVKGVPSELYLEDYHIADFVMDGSDVYVTVKLGSRS